MTKATISLFFLIYFVSGCKKHTHDVVCFPNSHIISNACVCDDGWFGWYCEKNSNEECGVNGYGVENWCFCKTGWTGNKCTVHVGKLTGKYFMTGTSSSWSGPTSSPPINIEDTIDVVLYKDTSLAVNGYVYLYSTFGDTVNNYSFYWPFHNNHSYSTLHFRKGNDSLFLIRYLGSLGSGTTTSLSGVKVQ